MFDDGIVTGYVSVFPALYEWEVSFLPIIQLQENRQDHINQIIKLK